MGRVLTGAWWPRVLGATLVAALVAVTSAAGAGRAHTAQACDDTPASAAALLCQINVARAAHGVGPLAVDTNLQGAAQQHAQAMVSGGAPFSTSSPLDPDRRVQQAGFADYTTGSAGEVIGAGTGSLATPSSTVQRWLASSSDGPVLLDPAFTLVGVGAVGGQPGGSADGATYAVLLLNQKALGAVQSGDVSGGGTNTGVAGSGGSSPNSRAPVAGRSVQITPVSGIVAYTTPGGSKTRLTGAKVIPVGSTIDATQGRIRLTAALPTRAAAVRTQTGDFYGGAMRVAQNGRTGLTTMTLVGSLSICKAKHASARAAARRGAQARHLWGSGKGSFSTRGQFAAATVRGTIWLTTDYCGGTLVQVVSGAVRVKNLVSHASVLVRPGHPYFAAAKKRR